MNLHRHNSLKYLSPAKTHSSPSMLVKVTRIWTEVMLLRSSNIKEQDRRCRRDKEQDRRCRRDKEQDRRCRLDMNKLSIKVMDVMGRRMVTREFYIKILDTREST